MAYIEVSDVHKSFEGRRILHGMNFQVAEHAVVGLLGPNGSGKTTMIRLVNGVILPDQGSMRVAGWNPLTEGNEIRRNAGIVTEGAGLYHDMSALENLRFFARLYGVTKHRRAEELLEQFDLTPHKDRPTGQFSTGMKKRLALAKALLQRPSLLFLDEPTNGLDPEGIHEVLHHLKELNAKEGTTILICSHVLQQMESVCGSYILMESGKVIAQGTKESLERTYRQDLRLRVETGLQMESAAVYGYPVCREGVHSLEFTLTRKEDISPLLTSILQESWVHSAEIVNRDLESLYFLIKEGARP
ncbi:ABC transporter ATP-binding protein [Paenibacillus gansuensis]|uniref:ABC transporter ATP-binding protein n=1 Tax=Paenibacillus gansuensis TaxID=306542 RepID=A0ABW5PA89_9BACL